MEQTAKRIGIWVFSGTGNTLKCAKALFAALIERGVSVGFHEIADGTERAEERDLVICYPVYGFNMPRILKTFCRNLKRGGNIWFLKTSGEPLHLNDNSSAELIRILRKNGYAIKGEFHFIMPYNMVFRHTDELASRMWETAKERIPDAAKKIANGEEAPIAAPLSAKIVSGLCRVEHWFYPRNGRLFRIDPKKCVRCQKCVKNCPTKNITFENGRFRFGKSCIGCVRYSFNCPTGAIHIGLIDFMRVNGPYDFTRDPKSAVLGRCCRKSYERYFAGKRD
jgi:NAD-dependent dihydropyrimidine dehydrogenase PreA subunit